VLPTPRRAESRCAIGGEERKASCQRDRYRPGIAPWSSITLRARIAGIQASTGLPRSGSAAVALALSLAEPLEAVRDARRLRREHPRVTPSDQLFEGLRPLYERYIAEVSAAGMAVSWESARYLRDLCGALAPRRVLDLGSGFTSVVLRHYASSVEHPVSVVSVDDDPRWLERTRVFLDEHGYTQGELRLWSDFANAPGEAFDVVFHDLASGSVRDTAMAVAVGCLSPRGVILFDDAHHLGHRRAARRAAGDARLATYNLYRWTRDDVGRFALLAAS
jgi:predicted O-methyltransferase YrrM